MTQEEKQEYNISMLFHQERRRGAYLVRNTDDVLQPAPQLATADERAPKTQGAYTRTRKEGQERDTSACRPSEDARREGWCRCRKGVKDAFGREA